jgi:hypothetical protein
MNVSSLFLIVLVVMTFIAISMIRIARDNERFAVSRLEKFVGFRGPGLTMKTLNSDHWTRISSGDRGEIVAPDVAKFNDIVLPFEAEEPLGIGEFARVTGFSDEKVRAVRDASQVRTIVCEKCGHTNPVS